MNDAIGVFAVLILLIGAILFSWIFAKLFLFVFCLMIETIIYTLRNTPLGKKYLKPLAGVDTFYDENNKARNESNIANYASYIKKCVQCLQERQHQSKGFLGGGISNKVTNSSSINNLQSDTHNGGNKNSLNVVNDFLVDNIFKPVKQVFQCIHLKRLYHRRADNSTKNERNPYAGQLDLHLIFGYDCYGVRGKVSLKVLPVATPAPL